MIKEGKFLIGAAVLLSFLTACRTPEPDAKDGSSSGGTVYEVTFGKERTGIKECDELTAFLVAQAREGEESVDERAAQDYIRALVAEEKTAEHLSSEELKIVSEKCVAFRSSLESKEENNPEKDAVTIPNKGDDVPPLPADNNGEPQSP